MEETITQPKGGDNGTITDGKTVYYFLLHPESVKYAHEASYSSNSVLGTSNPDLLWRSSSSNISLPKIQLISNGMNKDVTEYIKPLVDWISSGVLVRLSIGVNIIDSVYLTNFTYEVRQWRSGLPSQVSASLDCIISRDYSKVNVKEPLPASLTDRERFQYENKIKEVLKNPAIASKLKVTKDSLVSVSADGYATLRNSKGSLLNTVKITDLKKDGVIK
jgi:hypothetical protein